MQNLKAIILAAGKGTRMKSDVPKVLHQVCGRPILQYILDLVKSVGSSKTYVIIGHKSGKVKESLSKEHVAVEQEKLLGTADAVRRVEKYFKSFKGDVLILCGDTPLLTKSTIKNIIRKHKKLKSVCTFLTTVVHNPSGYGRIIRDATGNAVAIREDKDAVGFERDIAEINVGVYCFKAKELFKALKQIRLNKKKKEFYLTDVVEILFNNNMKVLAVETDSSKECIGINTREDLASVERYMRSRILRNFMLQGITVIDPESTYIGANVKIGKDTIINPLTLIEKNVCIGKNCKIGPFCHLRPGTKVGNNVEIGNFTEISRTKIRNKTTMKHFSYLGDSSVGSNVNIGAGAVTANYDGKQKNHTKISDSAFIGSQSVLVAPTKIGKKAVVGAGSVVTRGKNIPDNSISFGVPAKVISKKGSK